MELKANVSKIIQYDLEKDTINLRQSGMSIERITNELNASGKVPEDDQISISVVERFLNRLPAVQREMVRRNKRKLMNVVNNNMDIISEMTSLYNKTSNLLDAMEEQATENKKIMDPHKFKALSSEMREMLKMMIEIQRELNDYENTKKFMEIVMETVSETCPQSISIIIEKLKATQETQWLGQVLKKR